MKKQIFIRNSTVVLILFFLQVVNAQEDYIKLPKTKSDCPTIIINSNIISNQSFIKDNEKQITQMAVMKNKPNREDHRFYNLSENGVILVELDKKIKTKTQSDLNNFFGLNQKNKVYLNGYLIEDNEFEIATESIIEVELVLPNKENKLEHKSIIVWTISKENRMNGCNN